jgi:predicted RNase H-like HicB family nuclease
MPGCHSQGDTYAEAIANIKEAAELWLEVVADRAAREVNATPDAQLREIEL